jgi:pyruvate/oxaloacetate carboxyltransferase
MAKKHVKFMCTAFRDGFQSVYGARVLTDDFLPAVEAARDAGITWMEAGGGARFQSLYFYCNEDAFTMMELPPGCEGAHDAAFYEKTLRQILDAGIPYDSVCFKDASGTSVPSKVYETIKRARRMLPEGTLLDFHSHETAGIGALCYRAALDAGADAIDLSLAPVSGGTCQTDLVVMWHALRGTDYDLDINIEKVLDWKVATP